MTTPRQYLYGATLMMQWAARPYPSMAQAIAGGGAAVTRMGDSAEINTPISTPWCAFEQEGERAKKNSTTHAKARVLARTTYAMMRGQMQLLTV